MRQVWENVTDLSFNVIAVALEKLEYFHDQILVVYDLLQLK